MRHGQTPGTQPQEPNPRNPTPGTQIRAVTGISPMRSMPSGMLKGNLQ